MRIEYDARRCLFNLMIGNECIGQMSLTTFQMTFGYDAVMAFIVTGRDEK